MSSPLGNPPSTQPKFRQSVAVVIGINDYSQGITHLQSAVNDAKRLAQMLAEEHGYQVQLLVDQVSRERLVTLFAQELPALLGADDRLLVYFAGHGVADDGDDGPAGYLLPQDARPDDPATFLAMTELNQWLNALPCRHLLLILDCCFAGAFRWSSSRKLVLTKRTLYRERYDRFIQDPAWQVLTSAAFDQTAADLLSRLGTRPDDGNHSPFALALFDALAGKADLLMASTGEAPHGDGVITAPELYLYVRDQVDPATAQGAQRQTPGLWPLHRHGKGEYIFLVPGRQPDLPPAPKLTPDNNPYRGLEPYDEQHQELFFGRDELITQLRATVEQNTLTVVTGVSGSGKSSLVKAGLLPRLHHASPQDAAEPTAWQILGPVRPGAKPLQAFAALFEQPPEALDLATQVQAWLAAHPGKRLLLVIDQFEELVTLADENERAQIVQQVAKLLALSTHALRIVLTVRSDFEPQFTNGALKEAWAAGRFVVTAMTQDELREVIVQPAAARVLYFEPDELVDRIINDVVQMPGALPLLSFTMSELYLRYLAHYTSEGTDDRAMTEADYEALGGVAGALRTRANAEYDALDPLRQKSMQRLLLRMVALEGTELARRRVSRAELDFAAPGENERINEVIQRLVAARLVVTGKDEGGDAYVEPAHDALIQAWDRLWVWVRAEQENLLLQRRLTPAAMDWMRGGRAEGLLWNDDPRLRQADAARLAPESWLNLVEAEFVAASIKRRLRNQQRLIGSLVTAVVVFALLAGIAFWQRNQAITAGNERATQEAIAFGERIARVTQEAVAASEINARATQQAIAVSQRAEAERQGSLSRSRQLAVVAQSQLSADPERAILIALESNAITRTFESEDVLRRAISNSLLRASFGNEENYISAANFSADRLMLGVHRDNRALVQLLDLASLQPISEIDAVEWEYLFNATFSPDGRRAFTEGSDYIVRVWDVENSKLLFEVPGYRAVWSPDGTAIATAEDNLAANIWDVESGELRTTVGEGEDGYHTAMHFSPDSQQLVTINAYTSSSVYTATVWDIASNELVTEFAVTNDIEFSPDGALLAHGAEGIAFIRDAHTYEVLETVTSENLGEVYFQHFSPSGQYLITGSTDNSVRIWRVGTDISRIILIRITAGANLDTSAELAEFSPDERTLVTVRGSEMRLWDIASGDLLTTLRHGDEYIHTVNFSPNGRYLLSIGDEGTMRLWSPRVDEEWAMIPGEGAHFAPDNAQIAVATGATIRLWDATTQQPLSVTMDHGEPLHDLLFSADGKRIYGYGNSTVTWWNRADGQQMGALQVISGTLAQVTLSPDQSALATVTSIEREAEDSFDPNRFGSVVTLWSIANGAQVISLPDEPSYLNIDNIAFSPDGSLLLAAGSTNINEGGSNRLVRVWDVATGALRYGLDFGQATRAQFSPNGEQLVTVNEDEIALWRITDGMNLDHIPAGNSPISANPMSFSADGGRMIVQDGFSSTERLWDLNLRKPLFFLTGHSNSIAESQLAPDGSLILTASPGDGSVRLWDGTTGALLTLLTRQANHAELSADGHYLLAVDNGTVGVYLVRFDELLALAQTRVTRSLTCEEKRDFLNEAVVCPVVTPRPVAS